MAGGVPLRPGLAAVGVTEHHMLALGSRTNSHTVDLKPFIRDSHIALWEAAIKNHHNFALNNAKTKKAFFFNR